MCVCTFLFYWLTIKSGGLYFFKLNSDYYFDLSGRWSQPLQAHPCHRDQVVTHRVDLVMQQYGGT